MKALALVGPRQVALVDREVPSPGEGEVLVRVEACGICGSDLEPYRTGALARPYFGHEFCGRVAAVGPGVEGLAPGARVATGLTAACGACEPCQLGRPNFCEHAQATVRPGGFAEFSAASWSPRCRALTIVPDGLDAAVATLHEPISCALRIVERAGACRGAAVLVLGLGMMGLASGLLLKAADQSVRLLGVDGSRHRVALAGATGFDRVASPEQWRRDRGGAPRSGFDVVIDATGAAAAFGDAVAEARLGGTVVLAGVPSGEAPFAPLPIFRRELTIVGAKGPYPHVAADGTSRALEVLCSATLPWRRLVRCWPLDESPLAFKAADAGEALRAVVVLNAIH